MVGISPGAELFANNQRTHERDHSILRRFESRWRRLSASKSCSEMRLSCRGTSCRVRGSWPSIRDSRTSVASGERVKRNRSDEMCSLTFAMLSFKHKDRQRRLMIFDCGAKGHVLCNICCKSVYRLPEPRYERLVNCRLWRSIFKVSPFSDCVCQATSRNRITRSRLCAVRFVRSSHGPRPELDGCRRSYGKSY